MLGGNARVQGPVVVVGDRVGAEQLTRLGQVARGGADGAARRSHGCGAALVVAEQLPKGIERRRTRVIESDADDSDPLINRAARGRRGRRSGGPNRLGRLGEVQP